MRLPCAVYVRLRDTRKPKDEFERQAKSDKLIKSLKKLGYEVYRGHDFYHLIIIGDHLNAYAPITDIIEHIAGPLNLSLALSIEREELFSEV